MTSCRESLSPVATRQSQPAASHRREMVPIRSSASQPAEGAAEVLSLTGEVMKREKMDPALQSVYKDTECPLFVHIHISCAHRDGSVRGGGLAAGNAFRSLRIFMTPLG